MLKTKNLFSKMLAIILAVTMFALFVIPKPVKGKEVLRTIEVDNIGVMSYEEKIDGLINQFDSYDTTYVAENGLLSFNAQETITIDQVKNINFVNSYDEEVVKKYETTLNPKTMEFTIITKYFQNDEIVKEEACVVIPYYVQEEDDWKVELDNESVSVKEVLASNNFETCIAGVDDVVMVGGAAVLFVVAVVVCAPVVEEVVTTVVEVLKSFWGWLKGLFTTKTVTTTITTTVYKYNVKIGSKQYTLERAEDKVFTANKYYVVVADTESGFVYISTEDITYAEAVSVLASTTMVNAISGSNLRFVLSTYTLLGSDAKSVADVAATYLGGNGSTFHAYHNVDKYGNKKKGIFYQHYHPCYPYVHGTAHSFFGTPYVNI